MDAEIIVTTPSQLRMLLAEAVSLALTSYQQPNVSQMGPDRWMTIKELSDYLPGHMAVTTLYGKVQRREIPFSKVGNKRLTFLKSEIDQWLKGQHRKTQGEINDAVQQYLLTSKKGRKK